MHTDENGVSVSGLSATVDMQLTVDDLVEFQAHCLRTLPAAKQQLTTLRVAIIVIVVASPWLTMRRDFRSPTDLMVYGLLALAASLVIWFGYPWLHRVGMPGRIRRTVQRGLGPSMEPSRLTVDARGLAAQERTTATTYSWETIGRVEQTPTLLLIWVTAAKAIVLPTRYGEPAFAFVRTLEALRPYPPKTFSGR